MNPQEVDLLRSLLTQQRVLALSVIVDTRPVAGLLPFAKRADFAAVFVHASRLARHTAGLLPDAAFSAIIHEPDSPAADPLQLARVSISGHVQPLARESEAYRAARAAYLAKFPASEPVFTLPDFTLYALQIVSGRLVAGFGRAYTLSLNSLKQLQK